MTPGSTMKTPFALNSGDFPSKYFENTPSKGDAGRSQDEGMTPLTDFRESFTPYNSDGMFSHQINEDLSKTLFGEDTLEGILKTPKSKSQTTMRIRIGCSDVNDDETEDVSAQFRRQVTISPILDGPQRSKRFKDDLEHPVSVSFADKGSSKRKRYLDSRDDIGTPDPKSNLFVDPLKSCMKTPLRDTTMETAASDMSFHDISAQSPFDPAIVMQTPGTADSERNSSFWRHQFGFSPTEPDFTPFRSPKSESGSYCQSKLEDIASPKRQKLETTMAE